MWPLKGAGRQLGGKPTPCLCDDWYSNPTKPTFQAKRHVICFRSLDLSNPLQYLSWMKMSPPIFHLPPGLFSIQQKILGRKKKEWKKHNVKQKSKPVAEREKISFLWLFPIEAHSIGHIVKHIPRNILCETDIGWQGPGKWQAFRVCNPVPKCWVL